MAEDAQSNSNEVYVARQPILDQNQNLFGYELLYRSSLKNAFDGVDPTKATSRLIANSFLTIGIDRLAGERPAFINFGRTMLVDGYVAILPEESVVVEILEDVQPDAEVIAACQNLKERGYLLALDDFVCAEGLETLVDLADIIKVDFRLSTPETQVQLAKRFAKRKIRMLAEKVETQQEFKAAKAAGYELFQGYFFSKPAVVSAKEVPGFKLNYLRILQQISRPELDLRRIEEIVKYEASLVHRLLRYVNSAHFGWKQEVQSVRHALALLGENEIRKWISLVALCGMAGDKPNQLVVNAVMRGRFCELISRYVGLSQRGSELFLMGMFSLLDAVLDMPIASILEDVHLPKDVRETLLGQAPDASSLKGILELARAYERPDWTAIEAIANSLGVPVSIVPQAYLESVELADQIFRS